MKYSRALVIAVVASLAVNLAAAESPVRVLIITGSNNHDWSSTTATLKKIFEESGSFKVDVTEQPESMTKALLAEYDVLVNNWTKVGQTGHLWGEETETAVEEFVASGKGFVAFHAGSSCFYDWDGFQKIVGGTWGEGTGHGRYHKFEVVMTDEDHPITRGMEAFETTDELWHRIAVLQPTPGRRVLSRAMSSKESGGSGEMEDVVISTTFGKGRGVYITLGHDSNAMENQGFKQLMRRSVEWAATGEVRDGAD